MTEHDEPRIDQPELPPIPVLGEPTPGRPSWRRRTVVLAAVAALGLGSIALADHGDDEGPEPDREDEDGLLDLEPVVLDLAGPRDGNESIGLPLQVDPSTGLTDGQLVTVTGGGFVPGESVGIVQSAEATADQPGNAIDSCDISRYTPATASSDGVATGTYNVDQILTTPRTGTVDCLAEPGRCVVAMGALDDYDRSGVHQILFGTAAPGPDPTPTADLPTARVSPLVGLADGDIVRVEGEGFAPGDQLHAELCSPDPAVCWPLVGPDAIPAEPTSVAVDASGHLAVDLQVWRYLPGPAPATYVDCAVSRCELRLGGERVPEPIVLGFSPGGAPPVGGAIAVDPDEDLAPGDPVGVAGAGFLPGAIVHLELCAALPDDPEQVLTSASVTDDVVLAGDDGRFTVAAVIPELGREVSVVTTACGEQPGQCQSGPPATLDIRCDGVGTICTVRAWIQDGDLGYGRPVFAPAPAPISFRPVVAPA